MAEEERTDNVEETPAPEAEAEATEAVAEEASEAAADDAGGGKAAEAKLSPREQRRRERELRRAREASARPSRTPQERAAERAEARKAKAARRRARRAKLRELAKAGEPGQPTPPREREPGRQKVRQGIVVSDKPDKTITVRIDVARRHRRYEKIVRSSTTLHAHDERNEAHVGDTVVVRECRPLSRTKRWRLVEIVERAR